MPSLRGPAPILSRIPSLTMSERNYSLFMGIEGKVDSMFPIPTIWKELGALNLTRHADES